MHSFQLLYKVRNDRDKVQYLKAHFNDRYQYYQPSDKSKELGNNFLGQSSNYQDF